MSSLVEKRMYNLATILAVLIQPQRNKDVKYKSANSSLFREWEGGEEEVGKQREQRAEDKREGYEWTFGTYFKLTEELATTATTANLSIGLAMRPP